MLSLIVPCYAGGPALERTIMSAIGVCDDLVIVSTAMFDEDKERFREIAAGRAPGVYRPASHNARVVELPWNFVFLHGYGSLSQQGVPAARNDWCLLLGTGETFAEPFMNVDRELRKADRHLHFRCNHVNDPYTWKRVWNRTGGVHWSGIMHEELTGGQDGGLMFRMQDTHKEPRADPVQRQAIKFIKALSYNWLYHELLVRPERLGGASPWWLKFVEGARESITKYVADHKAMLDACIAGDLPRFMDLIQESVDLGQTTEAVNFKPLGQ